MRTPIALICTACGATGKYKVGTVTIDPVAARSSDGIEHAIGFTGYFRCRKCDAGGPWELTGDTMLRLMALIIAATEEVEEVPLIIGCPATFDKKPMRYATDGETHLKSLIDKEPERAFLWTRLGNLYNHAEVPDRAEKAYKRAIELDPADIEAHSMLGQLLFETGRSLESVPNFHAVLKNARGARKLDKNLRRSLVRNSIELLLAAHAEANGQIELLPTISPEELERNNENSAIVELREFDLGSEEGVEELCDVFLQKRRSGLLNPFRRSKKYVSDSLDEPFTPPIHRDDYAVGRNDPCPCGSNKKYKKCCGCPQARGVGQTPK